MLLGAPVPSALRTDRTAGAIDPDDVVAAVGLGEEQPGSDAPTRDKGVSGGALGVGHKGERYAGGSAERWRRVRRPKQAAPTDLVPVPPTIDGVSRQPQDDGPGRTGPGSPLGSAQTRRWAFAVVAVVLIVLLISSGMFSRSSAKAIGFSEFQHDLATHQVASASFNNSTGAITGTLANGTSYTTTGPVQLPDSFYATLKAANVKYTFSSPSSEALGEIIIYLLPIALIIGFFVWMSRRAQGQMSSIMSIGRSKA